MFKKYSLKKSFVMVVVFVVIFTIITTVIAEGLTIFILYKMNTRPSNYYNLYVGDVEKEIIDNMEGIIKGSNIDIKSICKEFYGEYLDLQGKHISGEQVVLEEDRENLIGRINSNYVKGNFAYKFIPMVGENKALEGVYVLKYPFGFEINNKNSRIVILMANYGVFIEPVIIFLFYLFIFTRSLYRQVNYNITKLSEAAENIKQNNLDFNIEDLGPYEFGNLSRNFDIMRLSLKSYIEKNLKMEEERKIIISAMVHDIRTPITIIRGQEELIRATFGEVSALKKYTNIIKSNCDRINGLINNLILTTKLDRPDFKMVGEKRNAEEEILNRINELQIIADRKKVSVTHSISFEKEIYVLDYNMINQVLDNILYNSLRFVPTEGHINIEVLGLADKIFIKCEDDGPGFAQRDLSKLFTMFYQGETGKVKNHSGLGLYIAKRIVNSHGGEIKAYNSSKRGAVLEFYISELS